MELGTLLERCRRGDELAWEAFVRQYQRRIYSLATCYATDADAARDLAQDVFVRLYRTRKQWRDAATFVPWMIRVARNVCLDQVRARKVRPPVSDVPADELVDLAATTGSPDDDYAASSRRRLFYRALRKLTDLSREIILLKEIQGLQIEEIAGMLHIPLGTVKSRSSRARLELARNVLALQAPQRSSHPNAAAALGTPVCRVGNPAQQAPQRGCRVGGPAEEEREAGARKGTAP
jgi:RNA polymerase sigma-70 factor (ECF subfamily)